MISVAEAHDRLQSLIRPLAVEQVPLHDAARRRLAFDVAANITQPPFPASAMDGYAVRAADLDDGATLTVVGEAAAGHGLTPGAVLAAGTAVRIFTGAPVPDGADHILIQEDAERTGDVITVRPGRDTASYIRPAGNDFAKGDVMAAGTRLGPEALALLAAMNIATVPVHRRPVVALVATGDELVWPGQSPGPDQIVASNILGLQAMFEAEGAVCRLLPIARDTTENLKTTLALAADADLVVTIGGASVGDHDLVQATAGALGMDLSFYKIRMRPGKPLMAGRLGDAVLVGLPGNPVSALVCGHLFLRPALQRMQGGTGAPLPRREARLAKAIPANGPREHYMRARLTVDGVDVFTRQDSALLSVMAQADCLAVRAPGAAPLEAGNSITIIDLM